MLDLPTAVWYFAIKVRRFRASRENGAPKNVGLLLVGDFKPFVYRFSPGRAKNDIH